MHSSLCLWGLFAEVLLTAGLEIRLNDLRTWVVTVRWGTSPPKWDDTFPWCRFISLRTYIFVMAFLPATCELLTIALLLGGSLTLRCASAFCCRCACHMHSSYCIQKSCPRTYLSSAKVQRPSVELRAVGGPGAFWLTSRAHFGTALSVDPSVCWPRAWQAGEDGNDLGGHRRRFGHPEDEGVWLSLQGVPGLQQRSPSCCC